MFELTYYNINLYIYRYFCQKILSFKQFFSPDIICIEDDGYLKKTEEQCTNNNHNGKVMTRNDCTTNVEQNPGTSCKTVVKREQPTDDCPPATDHDQKRQKCHSCCHHNQG